jgi:hypothetical protein
MPPTPRINLTIVARAFTLQRGKSLNFLIIQALTGYKKIPGVRFVEENFAPGVRSEVPGGE